MSHWGSERVGEGESRKYSECVCVCERVRKKDVVGESLRERSTLCVCVCERERERKRVRECVCVRE